MKRIITLSLLFMLSVNTFAQKITSNGGISDDMLSELKKGYTATQEQKAVRNALSSNSIPSLSTNADNISMIDTHFSDRVKTSGITNQKSSGRCWLFSGLNVLRSEMINKYKLSEMEFSQNYLFFFDQLEKSNLFLQAIIDTRKKPLEDREVDWLLKNPIGDGGQFTGVANLVMKYGLVPSSVMPETYQSQNTSDMSRIIKTKLREFALKLRCSSSDSELQSLKTQMLKEIYVILVKCLGVPPTEFSWSMKNEKGDVICQDKVFTPKSFYDEFLGKNLNTDYVMLMNDPSREYGKVYEIEYDRHVYDGQNWLFINLPIEEIKKMAISSIKDGTAMYFSCDVKKFLDKTKGTLDLNNTDEASLFSTSFPMDKKQRIQTFSSGSTHAMTLIAVDIKDGKTTKWMVENSWGSSTGYKGNLIMTDKWFDEYMFRLVVNKKYVPEETLKLLSTKPVMLPAWDPMFLPDE